MARVVMMTAMAGVGIDLQCGDIFETDDATAARLLDTGAAREETPKDKLAAVKSETKPPVVDTDGGGSRSRRR